MADPALTLLMRMLMRAALRQAWRLMKRPAGAIMTLFMLTMLSFGLIPSVVMAVTSSGQSNSAFVELLTNSIPLVMYAMAAAMVAIGAGDTLLELKPPELQFVLAGPFTNSQILSYRLLTLLIGWLPLSAFFALFMLPHFGSFLGAFLGISLGGAFITLIAFQYTLIKPNLSPRSLRIIRLIALLSLAVIALESARNVMNSDRQYSISMLSQEINEGWAGRILGAPFRPFATVLGSGIGLTWLLNTGISVGLVAALTFSCYQTNGGFSELAVEGVARRKKKLERIKGGNVYGVSARKQERTQLIPSIGWIGGVGPVAWSQLTSAFRRTGRLIPGVVLLGGITAVIAAMLLQLYPNALTNSQRAFAVPIALGAAAYFGFLLTMTAQTGFSGNRRLLTWYQTMPIRPISIAMGMIAGTFALLVSIQLALCLPALVVTSQHWGESLSIIFAGVSFSAAYASTINFVSATTDLRPMPQGTPDVFQGARAMIFMLVLGIATIPILLFAVGAAGSAGALFGFSWIACSIAAGVAMLVIQPVLWWVSGERFVRSEPTSD